MLPENMKNKKIMIPAILCLAVLVFLVRRLPSKQPTAKQEDAARVQVARAIYSDSLKKGLHTTVSLKAISDVVIRPKVESHLQNLYVKKGQMFQKGDLLLELEHNNQSAQVSAMAAQIKMNEAAAESAKSQKENAAAEQRRYDTLVEKGYATRQEVDARRTTSRTADSDYDKAVANIEYARSQLKAAEAELHDYMIYAPFDGVVLDDYDISIGSQVTKTTNVLRIADISQVKAAIEIPEIQLARLKNGMTVDVTCDALPGRHFQGRIEGINQFVNTETHTVRADVVIDNKAAGYILKPGMFARCFVIAEASARALVIPTEAIRSDGSVFVVRDNKAEEAHVKVELKLEKETAVSGINEGELIITGGHKNLKPGDTVTYKEP